MNGTRGHKENSARAHLAKFKEMAVKLDREVDRLEAEVRRKTVTVRSDESGFAAPICDEISDSIDEMVARYKYCFKSYIFWTKFSSYVTTVCFVLRLFRLLKRYTVQQMPILGERR